MSKIGSKTVSKICTSLEETQALARSLARHHRGKVLALFGDLGSGKTTFVQSFASFFGIEPESVCSPTFNYLNIYEGKEIIYHFDLYRLPSEREFLLAGFEEVVDSGNTCCIEWAEKIPSLLPEDAVRIYFTTLGKNEREIVVTDGLAT